MSGLCQSCVSLIVDEHSGELTCFKYPWNDPGVHVASCEGFSTNNNKSADPVDHPSHYTSSPEKCEYKLGELLVEAERVITGERQDSYGNPEDSFALIAKLWGAYIGVELTERQATDMMILFKVARLKGQRPTRDTYRDVAGYSSIAADRLLPRENGKLEEQNK